MKTFGILYFLFLVSVEESFSLFDIDELRSFNYGIEIRKEPVLLKEDPTDEDSNKVMLSSKYGQAYQCDFPNTVEKEKQKEEAEKEAFETGIPDLLKPMDQGPCLRKTKDWWTYEFCYGKEITQYHLSEDNQVQGEIMNLGIFESEYDWDDNEEQTDQKVSQLRRYHTHQYVNGSNCDLTGKQRKTEVRFMCEEGSADFISRVDEPESCTYVMTIHTMKICHHPFLKPPTPTQTVTITCNPVLTHGQYQEYQDLIRAEIENRRIKEEKEKEDQRKLQEEKEKYLKENQMNNDDEGEVEVEGEEEDLVEGDQEKPKEHNDKEWSNIYKATKATTEALKNADIKPVVKVVNSADELKHFLNEAMSEINKVKVSNPVPETDVIAKQAGKDEEEEEEVEVKVDEETEHESPDKGMPAEINVPKQVTDLPPHFDELKKISEEDTELDDPEMEESESETKTLKQRYKERLSKLRQVKARVKDSVDKQYGFILKEVQEETANEAAGLETAQDKVTMRDLVETLNKLLGKLDETTKDIEAVDKELEQFAEYDGDEKEVKSMPPVKEPVDTNTQVKEAAGPSKSGFDDRVKVRVSRVQKGKTSSINEEVHTKQTAELEKSVRKELEKAGLGEGDKIQVKIITTGYFDGDDDTLHVLSEEESETFRNMIVNLIGSTSEADRERAKHSEMEDGYNFVWGDDKSQLLSDLDLPSEDGNLVDPHSVQTDAQTLSSGIEGKDEKHMQAADTSMKMEDEES